MQGRSVCSGKNLNVSGIWIAYITENKVKEWRVYLDNEEIRRVLNI